MGWSEQGHGCLSGGAIVKGRACLPEHISRGRMRHVNVQVEPAAY